MHKFEDLVLWKKSMDLVEEIYKVTSTFPDSEKFNLTSQMRRCAVSIPSNIAEGCGRNSTKELLNFLSISNGSSSELLTQTILSQRLNLININVSEELKNRINEIQKMNYMLRKKLSEGL